MWDTFTGIKNAWDTVGGYASKAWNAVPDFVKNAGSTMLSNTANMIMPGAGTTIPFMAKQAGSAIKKSVQDRMNSPHLYSQAPPDNDYIINTIDKYTPDFMQPAVDALRNFDEGLNDDASVYDIPFIGTLGYGAVDTAKVGVALANAKAAQKAGDPINMRDASILKEFLDHEQMLSEKRQSMAYNVGETLRNSITFMSELGIAALAAPESGGTSLAGLAGKVATKGSQKLTLKLFKKEALNILKKSPYVTKQLAKQYTISQVPHLPEDVLRRSLDQFNLTQDEKNQWKLIITDTGQRLPNAIINSLTDRATEFLSEKSGFVMHKLAKPVKDVMFKTAFVKAFKRLNPTVSNATLHNIIRKMGWHGVFSEVMEERVGDAMHGVFHELGVGDIPYRIPSLSQWMTEFISFAIMGGAMKATDSTIHFLADPRQASEKEIKNIQKQLEQSGGAIRVPLKEIGNKFVVEEETDGIVKMKPAEADYDLDTKKLNLATFDSQAEAEQKFNLPEYDQYTGYVIDDGSDNVYIRPDVYASSKMKDVADTRALAAQIANIPFLRHVPIQRVQRIVEGKDVYAFGSYKDALIKFANNPHKSTVPHEAVHAFLDLLVSPEKKKQLFANVRRHLAQARGVKGASDIAVEEYLAQAIGNMVAKGSTATKRMSRLQEMLHNISNVIREYAGSQYTVDRFLKDMMSEHAAKRAKRVMRERKARSKSVADTIKKYQRAHGTTLKYLNEIADKTKPASWEYFDNLRKSLNLKKGEDTIIETVLDSPQFKGQKKIDPAELYRAIEFEMLGVITTEETGYDDYGMKNIGMMGSDIEYVTKVLETDFEHGFSDHYDTPGQMSHFRAAVRNGIPHITELQSDPFQKPAPQLFATEQDLQDYYNFLNDKIKKLEGSHMARKYEGARDMMDRQKERFGSFSGEQKSIAMFNKAYTLSWIDALEGVLKDNTASDAKIINTIQDAKYQFEGSQSLANTFNANNMNPGNQQVVKAAKAVSEELDKVERPLQKVLEANRVTASDKKKILSAIKKLRKIIETDGQVLVKYREKQSQRFRDMYNHWYEFTLKMAVRDFVKDGADKIRVTTPYTAAIHEGYMDDDKKPGDLGDVGELEWSGDEQPGDEVGYYGEDYIVVDRTEDTLTLVRGSSDNDDITVYHGQVDMHELASNEADDYLYEFTDVIDWLRQHDYSPLRALNDSKKDAVKLIVYADKNDLTLDDLKEKTPEQIQGYIESMDDDEVNDYEDLARLLADDITSAQIYKWYAAEFGITTPAQQGPDILDVVNNMQDFAQERYIDEFDPEEWAENYTGTLDAFVYNPDEDLLIINREGNPLDRADVDISAADPDNLGIDMDAHKIENWTDQYVNSGFREIAQRYGEMVRQVLPKELEPIKEIAKRLENTYYQSGDEMESIAISAERFRENYANKVKEISHDIYNEWKEKRPINFEKIESGDGEFSHVEIGQLYRSLFDILRNHEVKKVQTGAILKFLRKWRGKDNIKEVVDEYGMSWYEFPVTEEDKQDVEMFQSIRDHFTKDGKIKDDVSLDQYDRDLAIEFIDYARLKKPEDVGLEAEARAFAETIGINPDQTNGRLANAFEKWLNERPKYQNIHATDDDKKFEDFLRGKISRWNWGENSKSYKAVFEPKNYADSMLSKHEIIEALNIDEFGYKKAHDIANDVVMSDLIEKYDIAEMFGADYLNRYKDKIFGYIHDELHPVGNGLDYFTATPSGKIKEVVDYVLPQIVADKPEFHKPFEYVKSNDALYNKWKTHTDASLQRVNVIAEDSGLGSSILEKIKKNGGITISLITHEEPDRGYAYSPDKNTETAIDIDKINEDDLEEYYDKWADLLSKDQHYLGGWVDDGKVYLDVSKVIDNLADAIKDAQAANQLAIFDLSSYNTIYAEKYSEILKYLEQGLSEKEALIKAGAVGQDQGDQATVGQEDGQGDNAGNQSALQQVNEVLRDEMEQLYDEAYFRGTGAFAASRKRKLLNQLVDLEMMLKSFEENPIADDPDYKAVVKDIKKQIKDIKKVIETEKKQYEKGYKKGLKAGLQQIPEKMEKQLLKSRLRAIAKANAMGIKFGRKLGRETLMAAIKEKQTKLSELQDAAWNYAQNLPSMKERNAFLNRIHNIKTKKGLERVIAAIDIALEKSDRQNTLRNIKEILKRVKKHKRTGTGMDVEYMKKISDVLDNYNLSVPTNRTMNALKGLRDYIEREGYDGIPTWVLDKMKRLEKTNPADMTPQDIHDLNDTLVHLYTLGKNKYAIKRRLHESKLESEINRAIASTVNLDGAVKKRKMSFFGKQQRTESFLRFLHAPRAADRIDGRQQYKGWNVEQIRRLSLRETEYASELDDVIAETFSKIEAVRDGKAFTEKEEARLYWYLLVEQGADLQAETLQEAMGWESAPVITEQERQVADALRAAFAKYEQDVITTYEQIENKPFAKVDNYFPIKYEKDQIYNDIDVQDTYLYRTVQTKDGFTKERMPEVKKLVRTDVFAVFAETMRDHLWYIKMQPELNSIRDVVNSAQYQKHAGRVVIDWWKEYLEGVAKRGRAIHWDAIQGMMSAIRRNLSAAVLGYKLTTIMVQPTAVLDAYAYMGGEYGPIKAAPIFTKLLRNMIRPALVMRYAEEHKDLKARQGGQIEIRDWSEGSGTSPLSSAGILKRAGQFYKDKAFAAIRATDMMAAQAVYERVYELARQEGLSEAEARAEAGFVMEMTQGSSKIVMRPLVLNKGEGWRLWFTFQTFMLNRFGLMADMVGYATRDLRGAIKFLWGMGIFMLAFLAEQAIRDAYRSLFKDKKDEQSFWSVIANGFVDSIPFVNNLAQIRTLTGSPYHGRGYNHPLIFTLDKLFYGIQKVISGKDKGKGTVQVSEAIATLYGVPGTAQLGDLAEFMLNASKSPYERRQGASSGGGGGSLEDALNNDAWQDALDAGLDNSWQDALNALPEGF